MIFFYKSCVFLMLGFFLFLIVIKKKRVFGVKIHKRILELQFSYSIITVDALSTSSVAHNDGEYHSVHDKQCCDND